MCFFSYTVKYSNNTFYLINALRSMKHFKCILFKLPISCKVCRGGNNFLPFLCLGNPILWRVELQKTVGELKLVPIGPLILNSDVSLRSPCQWSLCMAPQCQSFLFLFAKKPSHPEAAVVILHWNIKKQLHFLT